MNFSQYSKGSGSCEQKEGGQPDPQLRNEYLVLQPQSNNEELGAFEV